MVLSSQITMALDPHSPPDLDLVDPLALSYDSDRPYPQVIAAVVSHIARGAHRNTAAAAVGLKPTTLRQWLLRGQEDASRGLDEITSLYVELYTKCKLAALVHESQMAETWAQGAIKPVIKRTYKHIPILDPETNQPVIGPDGPLTIRVLDKEIVEGINWTSIAEFMSRRYPERWSKANRMELTGSKGGPIETKSESQVRIEQASYPVKDLPEEVRQELLRQLLAEADK
jgi:hypothetical protein